MHEAVGFGFAPVPLKLSGEWVGGFSSNYVYVNNLRTPPTSCSLLTLQQALDPTGARAPRRQPSPPRSKHVPDHALHLITHMASRGWWWVLEHAVVSASRERVVLASSCSSSTSCLIPLVPVLFGDLCTSLPCSSASVCTQLSRLTASLGRNLGRQICSAAAQGTVLLG